jgi:hypothetical protein
LRESLRGKQSSNPNPLLDQQSDFSGIYCLFKL